MSVRSALYKKIEPEFPLDTHPEVRLDFDQVRQAAQSGYDRPFLLVDPNLVRTKARRFKAAMLTTRSRPIRIRQCCGP
jgi:ornithine decarboxylase